MWMIVLEGLPIYKSLQHNILGGPHRVARFFLVQFYQGGENIPGDYKIIKMPIKYTQW
jgi:hypothetical protein